MSDNWVVQNLMNALNTRNEKPGEIWNLVTLSPQEFKVSGKHAASFQRARGRVS